MSDDLFYTDHGRGWEGRSLDPALAELADLDMERADVDHAAASDPAAYLESRGYDVDIEAREVLNLTRVPPRVERWDDQVRVEGDRAATTYDRQDDRVVAYTVPADPEDVIPAAGTLDGRDAVLRDHIEERFSVVRYDRPLR